MPRGSKSIEFVVVNLVDIFRQVTEKYTTIIETMLLSLRHSCVLHSCIFLAGPSPLQSFPPLAGGGLVQVLVSVCVPPPHVTLQLEESDQSV